MSVVLILQSIGLFASTTVEYASSKVEWMSSTEMSEGYLNLEQVFFDGGKERI